MSTCGQRAETLRLERIRPRVFQATLHAYELATLLAAARYVVELAPEELPEESLQQLRGLLDDYDRQRQQPGRRTEAR